MKEYDDVPLLVQPAAEPPTPRNPSVSLIEAIRFEVSQAAK